MLEHLSYTSDLASFEHVFRHDRCLECVYEVWRHILGERPIYSL